MKSDIRQFFMDYNVPFSSEGHKHCRPGWLNMPCPYCSGNEGLHLGFTENGKICYCWRCGWHPVPLTVGKLLKIPEKEARKLLLEYVGPIGKTETVVPQVRTKAHKTPSDLRPLQKQHKKYLLSRGFDPEYLINEWGLLGTGPASTLDGINYSHRIFAPIVWDDKQVSFQTRDITNKHSRKYLVCPKDRELIEHKRILYGDQRGWDPDCGICVEGITDVWRLGKKAFATFGIEYTHHQVRLISSLFRTVFVLFDDDPQAKKQAKELVGDLKFRGTDARFIPINGDPGSMEQVKANTLVKQLTSNDFIK